MVTKRFCSALQFTLAKSKASVLWRITAVLSKKQVIVFASTGAPKIEPKQSEVISNSLPAIICQCVKYFPLPGAYDYSKLDFKDKALMNLGPYSMLRLKAWFRRDQKAKVQLSEFGKVQDWTSQEAVNPIVNCVKSAAV